MRFWANSRSEVNCLIDPAVLYRVGVWVPSDPAVLYLVWVGDNSSCTGVWNGGNRAVTASRDIQVPSRRSFDRKSFPRSRSGSESVLSARLYFWGNPGIFERLKIETSIFQNVPTVQKAHLASEITSGARFMTGDLLDLFRIGFKATEDQISDASPKKCILAKISGRRALVGSRKVIRCSESDWIWKVVIKMLQNELWRRLKSKRSAAALDLKIYYQNVLK